MENIFENVKFGDKFLTKNGKCLIFWYSVKEKNIHCFIREGVDDRMWYDGYGFMQNGTILDGERLDGLDIDCKCS